MKAYGLVLILIALVIYLLLYVQEVQGILRLISGRAVKKTEIVPRKKLGILKAELMEKQKAVRNLSDAERDRELMEMAQVFRVPWMRRLGYIYLPHLKPFLFSACSVALGMSWKSGVAAEVIGVAAGSIGEKLYESKVYFLTSDLLAWTVVIVVISVLFEKAFLRLMKAAFDRWEGR